MRLLQRQECGAICVFSDVDAAAPEAGDADDYGFDVLRRERGFRGDCLRPQLANDEYPER